MEFSGTTGFQPPLQCLCRRSSNRNNYARPAGYVRSWPARRHRQLAVAFRRLRPPALPVRLKQIAFLKHPEGVVAAKITARTRRGLRLPLTRPYRLSYRTFEEFEPYLVEIADNSGRTGFADGHISPGSSVETREGGWAFMREHVPRLLGQDAAT